MPSQRAFGTGCYVRRNLSFSLDNVGAVARDLGQGDAAQAALEEVATLRARKK